MRQLVSILFLILLVSSCQNKEDRANTLIRKQLIERLHNFDSYTPIESNLSKAYESALNDSLSREKAMNIVKIREAYQLGMSVLQKQMEDVGLLSSGQQIQAYWANSIQKYPEIVETHNKIDNLSALLDQEISILRSIQLNKNKQIGYSVYHKFRYRDSNGNPAVGLYYYLFDNKLEKILCVIDMNDENNKRMIDVLHQFKPG